MLCARMLSDFVRAKCGALFQGRSEEALALVSCGLPTVSLMFFVGYVQANHSVHVVTSGSQRFPQVAFPRYSPPYF